MPETRQVRCKVKPDEILAEIEMPDGTSEERWAQVLSGYACTEHGEEIIHHPNAEERIEILETKMGKTEERLDVIEKKNGIAPL